MNIPQPDGHALQHPRHRRRQPIETLGEVGKAALTSGTSAVIGQAASAAGLTGTTAITSAATSANGSCAVPAAK